MLRAIAEHRSFRRAAEALFTTQPAVSRQLAALEREVGVRLVERGPRHVALTSAGAALLEEAERILPAIDAAERRLRRFAASDGGAVRLGAVPSALAALVPPAVRALRARRPRVEVEAEEGWSTDLVRLALRGELDLAVVSAAARGAGADVLLREPFVAILPGTHVLARRARLGLRDLADERWIVAPGPGGRLDVLAACAAAGFAPHVSSSAGWDAAAELVGAGLGVALAPASVASRACRADGVVARPVLDAPVRELTLVRAPGSAESPVARDLEGCLRDAARELSSGA